MEIDEILTNYIGEIGKYQIFILIFACSVCINTPFNSLDFVFIAQIPEYWCGDANVSHLEANLTHNQILQLVSPLNQDGSHDSCARYDRNYVMLSVNDALDLLGKNLTDEVVPCSSWNYNREEVPESIVTEWDLVCDRYWLIATSQTVYMAGQFSPFIGGWLSDRIGRKRVAIGSVFFSLVARVGQGMAPNYLVFVIFRCLLSVASMNMYTLFFLIGLELVGPKWRVMAGQIPYYFWSLGYMILPVVAYFIRDWRTLSLTLIIFIIPYFLHIRFLPESVRWLHAQKQNDAVIKILLRMAKSNGKKITDKVLKGLLEENHVVEKTRKKTTFKDLFKSKRIIILTLLLVVMWSVTNLVYYGLIFYLPNLGGNIFISMFIAGALEIPALLYVQLTLDTRLGRRLNTSLTFLVSGISLFVLMAIPKGYSWIILTLALLGKFANAATFSIIYVHTSEIYPTTLRGSGLSFCSTLSRFFSLLAPQFAYMGNVSPYLPPSIFATLSVVAGILSLLLPETRGKILSDNMSDIEDKPCKVEPEIGDENNSKVSIVSRL